MMRRTFLVGGALAARALSGLGRRGAIDAAQSPASDRSRRVSIVDAKDGEDIFAWLSRVHGGYDVVKYRQVLGAANPFKEGDEAQGLAAADDDSRENSRRLLAATSIGSLLAH